MGVKRSNVGQYVSIPCVVFALGLSPHALTLLVYALSRPDWFEFSEKEILGHIQIGRTTLHKAIDELRSVGLVTGTFRTGLTFYDEPDDPPSPEYKPEPTTAEVCSRDEQESEFVRDANKVQDSLFARRTTPSVSRTNENQKFVREMNNSSNSLLINKNNKTTTPLFEGLTRPCRADEVREWFDFSAHDVQELRAKVVTALWCSSLRADVIDRATAAILLFAPGASLDEYRRIRTEARYRETDARPAWAIVNLAITKIYDAIGWEYTPTRIGDEPRPIRPDKPAGDDELSYDSEVNKYASQAGIEPGDDYDTCLAKLGNTSLHPMARAAFANRLTRLQSQG